MQIIAVGLPQRTPHVRIRRTPRPSFNKVQVLRKFRALK